MEDLIISFECFEKYINTKIPNNKLLVIINENSKERLLIHQYLENKYPNMQKRKTSLRSDLYYGGFYSTFYRCYHCNYSRVPINNYHRGCMENNQDEYRTGTCPRCDEIISWEPNYDNWDDIKRLKKNNMIVIGDYINVNTPNHAINNIIDYEEFKKILFNANIYEIISPKLDICLKKDKRILSKKQLQKYIDDRLKICVK